MLKWIEKLYLKFLESKSVLPEVSGTSGEVLNKQSLCLTIKEAVTRVIETEPHGLTVEQVYNRITENNLYSFGTQNPLNVVRVEIDRACENSNYAIHASKKLF